MVQQVKELDARQTNSFKNTPKEVQLNQSVACIVNQSQLVIASVGPQ